MKVSICKNAKTSAIAKNSNVYNVLESIKNETYKHLIARVRVINDKNERSELKAKTLPLALFCGTFSTRSKKGLLKHSGLSCVDMDHVGDIDAINELKEKLNNDEYTFASFISPSGDGLKLLAKIPKVDNDLDYKDYNVELRKHYDQYFETDAACSDISRACFLSTDKDLFVNSESALFTKKFNRPLKVVKPLSNIPIIDSNKNAEILEKNFRKRFNGTNRNSNLHGLARAFNSYGVDQSVCEECILRYEESDFGENEILLLIKSAYGYTSEFGTQNFEDSEKVKLIKNRITAGKEVKTIEGISKENLDKEVQKHKDELKLDEFWYFTDKEVMKLATYRFKRYLENNNITKYYPSTNSGNLFIKKEGNFIKDFYEDRIKDFVLEDLDARTEIEAFEMMANSPICFSQKYLSMLSTSGIDIQKDNKYESFIYYKNTAVKVTHNNFELIDYDNLNGLVWEDQVIDRNLSLDEESDGEFKTFIWKISGENKERYYTMKSVLGYLLHSHQNEAKPKVIIFNDEMISDVPNGGSGKGLIHKAIGQIKKLSTINGKGFDPNKQFAYQTVDPDTQNLLFDDIDKNFKFENLFSIITEGIDIEKKGKDTIQIPFADSPKISITTNYTVKGEGSSHLRRIFEVEMSSYFSDQHTPEDEFGHMLFSEWEDVEYAKFDNYMLRCIQYYLKEGLVESKTINLELRKLRNDTNPDFIEFMDNLELDGNRYYNSELKDLFTKEYEDYKNSPWFKSRLFNQWLTKYCDFKGLALERGKTNGKRFVTITKTPF